MVRRRSWTPSSRAPLSKRSSTYMRSTRRFASNSWTFSNASTMRTHIALELGQFDPWAHREPQYLNGRFTSFDPRTRKAKHTEWLNRLDEKEANSKEQFA